MDSKNASNTSQLPLLSEQEIASPTRRRFERTPTWIWGLVGVLVLLGTFNFVLVGTLYKAFTDEYAFFVNQGINLMYVILGGAVLYPKQLFTNEINKDTGLNFPQREFLIMGFLDSLGTLFTAFGSVHTPNAIQPLLNQTLIPFTMIFSYMFLHVRYHRYALLGALLIIVGASLTVFPCISGIGECKSSVSVEWYSVLIYTLSNVPMGLSAVYKEIAFKDVHVNVWYLCQWVSIYQFLLSWLYLPLTVLPEFGGNGWKELFPRFWNGMQCWLGSDDVCPKAYDLPFPCDERLGTFWLLLGYCVVNFTFNYVGLVLTKHSSATIRSVSYAVILPATSLAFSLQFMGELREKLTIYVPIAIVVVLIGFALYQRFSDISVDEPISDEESRIGEHRKTSLTSQPVFCERTGGLDLVPRTAAVRWDDRRYERSYSTPHTPSYGGLASELSNKVLSSSLP